MTAVLADLLRTGLATEDTGILALTELGRLAGAGMSRLGRFCVSPTSCRSSRRTSSIVRC